MSNFPDTVSDGQRYGKTADKSNFTQTCNLLSQFLKEQRSSGSPSSTIGMATVKATTSLDSLVTNLQSSNDASRQNIGSAVNFLPQFVETENHYTTKQHNLSLRSPEMTIFYGGKVLVFEAFPPEKATEVMELATKLGSHHNINSAHVTPGSLAFGSDMRYPRRASLLKFLEKRKERVIDRGPYQINNAKHDGSRDPQHHSSKHFDLNL